MSEVIVSIVEKSAIFLNLSSVVVVVVGLLVVFGSYLRHFRHMATPDLVQEFKLGLGRTVLIGLEILVAATIVKTVTVKPTLVSIGLLGGIIIVRTILSWAMALEMDGHWPWQSGPRIREGNSKGG